jgi:uncharacterized protein (DUF1778 family)
VDKKEQIASRRKETTPLGSKVFSYYTQRERKLLEKAARLERRSLSSFVAIAAVDRANQVISSKK